MAVTEYASYDDVSARAGRFAAIFEVSASHPNQADVEQLLADCCGLIDSGLRARGYTPSSLDAGVSAAFRDVAAYGALGRALAGVPDPPDDLAKLREFAQGQWAAVMGVGGALAAGTFAPVAELDAGTTGPSAGDFWGDNPGYGTIDVAAEALSDTLETFPAFLKGQSL